MKFIIALACLLAVALADPEPEASPQFLYTGVAHHAGYPAVYHRYRRGVVAPVAYSAYPAVAAYPYHGAYHGVHFRNRRGIVAPVAYHHTPYHTPLAHTAYTSGAASHFGHLYY